MDRLEIPLNTPLICQAHTFIPNFSQLDHRNLELGVVHFSLGHRVHHTVEWGYFGRRGYFGTHFETAINHPILHISSKMKDG